MNETSTNGYTLNDAQRQAVDVNEGPALIVAGAGTGKTRVLVERIVRLLDAGKQANSLLALTFTEKAAAEMQDRVNSLTGHFQTDVTLMTFNAFGESLLREFAADIGLNRNFKVMGDNAQVVFLRERLDQLELEYFAPISGPDSQLGNLSDYFSVLKQNVIIPDVYLNFVADMPENDDAAVLEKHKHQELARSYDTYIKLCRSASVIDYDDQIYTVIELLRKRPNVLKQLQARYEYVLVDEFQDTNTMQSVFVDLLANKHKNLFVVGDDDQSIYGWRGATLANILEFKERYPKAASVTLTENYRSTQAILDAAYRLIVHNNPDRLETRLHINKQLKAQRDGAAPNVYRFDRLDEELRWIAEDIAKRIQNGTAPSDIAILSRRNITVERLAEQLAYAEVDHVIVGQRFDIYAEPLVRCLVEALKAITENNNNALYHTLTGPLFEIPTTDVTEALALAKLHHSQLRDELAESESTDVKTANEKLQTWRDVSGVMTVGQMTYHILEDSGLKDRLYQSALSDPLIATSVNRLSEFFQTLKEFERVAIQPSVVQYLDALPALLAADGSSEDGTLDLSNEVVNVLSIHKAKGLEWPIVYVTDCTEGSFPLTNRSRGIALPEGLRTQETEADDHIAEERRLMYVAMTRAKDELIMTLSDSHGGSRPRKPSRFLQEAFGTTDFSSVKSQTSFDLASLSNGYAANTKTQVVVPTSILDGNAVKLSVSQVIKYLDCPLDFYYRYVLRVPSEPSPSQAYGTLMHSILEELNRCIFSGKALPKLNELQARLQNEWPLGGYLSAAQRERAKAQGMKTLSSVYESVVNSPRMPIAIEEPFRINVPDANLTIRGRFDAVFPLGDSVEVVDYKTSSGVDTPEKAKSRASSSEQLTLYALAWQVQHDELPALVTLDFIESGLRGSLKKTQRGIDGAYTRLAKVADGIRNQAFAAGKEHRFCIHPPIN